MSLIGFIRAERSPNLTGTRLSDVKDATVVIKQPDKIEGNCSVEFFQLPSIVLPGDHADEVQWQCSHFVSFFVM